MATPDAFAPVAITRRSGFDESVHFGAVVGLSSTGEIEFSRRRSDAPIYPRSSNKPMQAVAMVRAGLHVAARSVGAGLRQPRRHPDARRGRTADPGDRRARRADRSPTRRPSARPCSGRGGAARGGGPTPLQMNCSGKHSGMVVTSAINGWPTDAGYLSPDHPLQQHITATIDELAGRAPQPHRCRRLRIAGPCDLAGRPGSRLSVDRHGRRRRIGRPVYTAMTTHPGDGRRRRARCHPLHAAGAGA